MRIIPPGSGIIHQVNLEYLARVVFDHDGYYYPDSLVGTDSHTTMIDGLGVLGWGEYRSRFLFHIRCSIVCSLIYSNTVTAQEHDFARSFVFRLLLDFQCLEKYLMPSKHSIIMFGRMNWSKGEGHLE